MLLSYIKHMLLCDHSTTGELYYLNLIRALRTISFVPIASIGG